jgi:hypothetical protein
MSLDAMYGRTTVRPIVGKRMVDVAWSILHGRRLPIRTIGRTVVRPYIHRRRNFDTNNHSYANKKRGCVDVMSTTLFYLACVT